MTMIHTLTTSIPMPDSALAIAIGMLCTASIFAAFWKALEDVR